MPSLHTVQQWDRVQEPINGQCPPTTGYWLHLLCPISPQSNRKLQVFHKYFKPTLKKLCENDPDNWDNYINWCTSQLPCNTTPGNHWNTLLPSLWKGSQSTPFQLLEPMQQFLGDPESRHLDLISHHLALAITKKILDNRFKHAQKTTDCTHLILKLVTEYTSKTSNLENGV